ncbi:hypothetical protein FQN57_007375 [Myotisia sp. PD_48]|nr:hypothetical protein FQN57_007375 [Myotisia sp. PD_48]
MPRADEVEWWFNAVYGAIQQIPHGKVTTYGHIARLLDTPQRSRQVGICLKHLPSSNDEFYNNDNVPWQRVINSKGMISHRGPGSAARQAAVLRQEGVQVDSDSMGEFYVDLAQYGWFPAELPGEESDSTSQDTETDGVIADVEQSIAPSRVAMSLRPTMPLIYDPSMRSSPGSVTVVEGKMADEGGSSGSAPSRPSGNGSSSSTKLRPGGGSPSASSPSHRMKIADEKALSTEPIGKGTMYVEDLAEYCRALLATTEMLYLVGYLCVQVILFCHLAGYTGNRPTALLEIRLCDLDLSLVRDPVEALQSQCPQRPEQKLPLRDELLDRFLLYEAVREGDGVRLLPKERLSDSKLRYRMRRGGETTDFEQIAKPDVLRNGAANKLNTKLDVSDSPPESDPDALQHRHIPEALFKQYYSCHICTEKDLGFSSKSNASKYDISEDTLIQWQRILEGPVCTIFSLLTYHFGALQHDTGLFERGTGIPDAFDELVTFMSQDKSEWEEGCKKFWRESVCCNTKQVKSVEELIQILNEGRLTRDDPALAEGKNKPTEGDKVSMAFDRNIYDSKKADRKGQRFTAFEDCVQGMSLGERRTLTIKADNAYGEHGFPGKIPPNADIVS